MGFLGNLFGSNKIIQQGERKYLEKDNRGTRQESIDKATAYWAARRHTQKFDPFALYVFDEEAGAKQALLDLEYMHLADDSGKIVCSETFEFGYYKRNDGKYEAIVCGGDLTVQDWESARTSFTGHGGIKKNEQRPEKEKETKSSKKVDADPKKVIFIREDKTRDASGTATYRTYKAPDVASAKAFLEQNPVSESQYYLVVETPGGNYGRDKDGIYKE